MQKSNPPYNIGLIIAWVLTMYTTYTYITQVIPKLCYIGSKYYFTNITANTNIQFSERLLFSFTIVSVTLVLIIVWAFTLHFTYKSINHEKVK